MKHAATPKVITRDDLEAKFRSIQGEVAEVEDDALSIGTIVIAAVAISVVVVAFALGNRRGKRRRTVLEIRRG